MYKGHKDFYEWSKKETTTIRIEKKTKDRIKLEANKEGISMMEYIKQLLDERSK